MDAHTLLEEWEVSPFDGGLDGVRDLQARGFSGAVEAGGSVLFLRDGDPIAVVEDLAGDPTTGDLDALDGAAADLHTAQRAETATLAAMLALDGDVRGQYFTEDTSLSTVHETLSEGGFTGYVELSENVLSGDYYVVYRDGREEYVAFVGSSNQVLVDEEARTRAEGEVGIYSVVAVTLPDVDVPRPDESGGSESLGGTATAGAPTGEPGEGTETDGPDDGPATAEPPTSGEPTADATGETVPLDADSASGTRSADAESRTRPADAAPDAGSTGVAADEGGGDGGAANGSVSNVEDATTEPGPPDRPAGDGDGTATPGPGETETTGDAPDATGATAESAAGGPGSPADPIEEEASESADVSGTAEATDAGSTDAGSAGDGADDPSVTGTDGESVAGAGGEHGGTVQGDEGSVIDAVSSRTVPSLDPQNSRRVHGDSGGGDATAAVEQRADAEPASESEPPAGDAGGPPTPEGSGGPPERVPESAPGPDVEERVTAVREEYEGRLQALQDEIEELRAERDDLRERIEALRSGAGGADGAGGANGGSRSLSPSEAIAGTSLFVREGTRGGATLEDALDGGTDRETLAENVRIEYHTAFDDDGVTVEGQPFEAWLHGTAHYRFVRWAVVDLPFEIRSTGSASSLRPLYEAIPAVDRIGLRDAVAVGEGDEAREISSDVVARNQMGEPLFVATIDESRDPTAGDAMAPLVTDASDVCEYNQSLAGTFAVTSSYFEPAALDTVREATSGSLLGRDRYRSYVKLARKNGFHVCMVEQRNGDFHLTVPEL